MDRSSNALSPSISAKTSVKARQTTRNDKAPQHESFLEHPGPLSDVPSHFGVELSQIFVTSQTRISANLQQGAMVALRDVDVEPLSELIWLVCVGDV